MSVFSIQNVNKYLARFGSLAARRNHKKSNLLSCHCRIRLSLPFLQNQFLLALLVDLEKRLFLWLPLLWWTFSRAGVATPFLVASAQSFSKFRKFQGEESRLLQKNCWNSLIHGNEFSWVLFERQTCNSEDCSRPACKGLQLYSCQARGEKSNQILAQASLNPPLKESHYSFSSCYDYIRSKWRKLASWWSIC